MLRFLRTEAESLDFTQTTRFATAATQVLAQRYLLPWPGMGQALQATARYWMSEQSAAVTRG